MIQGVWAFADFCSNTFNVDYKLAIFAERLDTTVARAM